MVTSHEGPARLVSVITTDRSVAGVYGVEPELPYGLVHVTAVHVVGLYVKSALSVEHAVTVKPFGTFPYPVVQAIV